VYAPRWAPPTAYDPAKLVIGAPVGSATLTFNAGNDATLDYTIAGQSGRKSLARTPF
jgi:hypothetical protein